MTPCIEIRVAGPEDAAAISALARDALRQVSAADYSADDIDRLAHQLRPARIAELTAERHMLVALIDGAAVGTASLDRDRVKTVFVAPLRHRQGVGAALLRAVAEEARGRGATRLTVQSALGAVAFYASQGFVERRRHFYGTEETAIMDLTLCG